MLLKKEPQIYTRSLTLAASGSNTFGPPYIPCFNAALVYFGISCDVAHTLTAATVTFFDHQAKLDTVALASGSPGTGIAGHVGIDSPRFMVNALGWPGGVDLRTVAGSIILRPKLGGVTGPYGIGRFLPGVHEVTCTITKDATVGNAVYTLTAVVYYYS